MKFLLLTGSRQTAADFVSLLSCYLDIRGDATYEMSMSREAMSVALHARRRGSVDYVVAWLEGSTNDREDFLRHFPDTVSICTEFENSEDALHCAKTL